MSDKNTIQNQPGSTDSKTSIHSPKGSWAERNFASIMGGGVFVLLALITLVMYIVSN